MHTVLLVEDDPEVLAIGAEILREGGYIVLTAENANEGLRVLANLYVDAIVTDIVMPGMNGFEFARRAKELIPQLPVLCTTGYSYDVADKPSHCEGVLPKPWSADRLQSEVGRLLGRWN